MKTLVIAEPGCTHKGDYDTLVRLLETAAACGADVFKPGWTSSAAQMCERRHISRDHPKRAYYEQAYTWLAWPVEWHAELQDRCLLWGIRYASSVYLPQDVATLAPFVEYLKVSSFEVADAQMEAACDNLETTVIASFGMGADAAYWPDYGLHCVSAYPAPLSALNLRVLHDQYLHIRGYSDHSRHLLAGAIAVACGATIIETHYRLDDCDPANPDYVVAWTPAELTQYVRNIRDAEVMLGSRIKAVQDCEREMLAYRVSVKGTS